MKRVFVAGIVVLALMALGTACNKGTISKCDAVRIARAQMPSSFAHAAATAGLNKDAGTDGTWTVVFPVVDIPFAELGWEGDASQYFKVASDNAVQRDMPEGVYGNVVIYVDARTGKTTGREINNELFLGGPGIYADCK